jgi:mRNA interferase MazF
MKRGEIWTISGAGYAGKPRPAVIIQDDSFSDSNSITICIFTTTERDAPLIRIPVAPSEENGLRDLSHLMVDKITTIPKTDAGRRIGRLADDQMHRLSRAILVFLGLLGPQSQRRTVSRRAL